MSFEERDKESFEESLGKSGLEEEEGPFTKRKAIFLPPFPIFCGSVDTTAVQPSRNGERNEERQFIFR